MSEESVAPDLDATDDPSRWTWALSPAEFAATKERAAKINARAAKRGFTGRIEVTGTEREVTETDAAGLERTRIVVDTRISGEAPCYNGWQFLAAVDTIETENRHEYVLRTAPGIEHSGVDRSTLQPGYCGHCKTTRTNRRRTFLVRNTNTGETVQVGSTCIKDFTGWAGKPVFFSEEELGDELGGFIGGLGGRDAYSPETVIAVAWAVSRRHGWVPASGAIDKPSTRTLVSAYLYGRTPADVELRAEIAPEVPAAQEKAQTIITALLDGLEGDGDYVTNLKTLMRGRYVEDRHMGYVVSAVSAYERMVGDRIHRDAVSKVKAESQFAGAKGDKITVTGTVSHLQPVQNTYGYTTTTSMLVVIEAGTTVAKMFTSAAWAFEIEQGQEITVTGTVKVHELYNDVRQTVLNRPKMAASPAAEPRKAPRALAA